MLLVLKFVDTECIAVLLNYKLLPLFTLFVVEFLRFFRGLSFCTHSVQITACQFKTSHCSLGCKAHGTPLANPYSKKWISNSFRQLHSISIQNLHIATTWLSQLKVNAENRGKQIGWLCEKVRKYNNQHL